MRFRAVTNCVVSLFLVFCFYNFCSHGKITKLEDSSAVAIVPGADLRGLEGQVTIIGTVDGNIHAIDSQLNHLWTSSTGGPLAKGGTIRSSVDEKSDYIIPSLDGTLLVHSKSEGMRKTSVTARILADKTPFVSGEGVAFTGSKEDRIIGFDLSSGLSLLDRHDNVLKLTSKKKSVPLFFGREDFVFRGIDTATGGEKFTFSFSELFPLSEKARIRFSGGRDESQPSQPQSSGQTGEQQSIISTPEGFLYFLDAWGAVLNEEPIALNSPAVNAFVVTIEDGEAVSINRLVVRHSLNQLRNFLKLSKPASSLAVQRALSAGLQRRPQGIISGLLPVVVPEDNDSLIEINDSDRSNMVIVQANIGTENDGLYGMEIMVPSDHGGATGLSLPRETLDNEPSQPPSNEFDSIECERILELDRLDTLGRSKSRLHINRQKIHLADHLQHSAHQLRQQQQRTMCQQQRSPSKEENGDIWSSLERYLSEQDGGPAAHAPSTDGVVVTGIGNIRGMHKLSNAEPKPEFWLPKIHKDLQRNAAMKAAEDLASAQAIADASNPGSLAIRATATTNALLSAVLVSLVSMVLVFLLVSLAIVAYVRNLSKDARLGEQPVIVQRVAQWLLGAYPQMQYVLAAVFKDVKIADTGSTIVNATDPAVTETRDEKGRKILRVGALRVYETVIGVGSHGTVIFVGTLHSRPVAVKRMLSMLHRSAEREMSLLIKSDGHPNVVRYFVKEECNDFVYLGLQLCVMSVKDFVQRLRRHSLESQPDLDPERLQHPYGSLSTSLHEAGVEDEVRLSLLQVAQGLAFLHSQKILHRDIKPHNILCALPSEATLSRDDALSGSFRTNYLSGTGSHPIRALRDLGEFVLKISDMGLSKQLLEHHEASFSRTSASLSLLATPTAPNERQRKRRSQKRKASVADDGAVDAGGALADDGDGDEEETLGQDEVGTIGWQAPEIIARRHHTPTASSSTTQVDGHNALHRSGETDAAQGAALKADVFSLGCVYYYLLSLGGHPFGAWFERENNIAQGKCSLALFEEMQPDVVDLLTVMLGRDPTRRPAAQQVVTHPFFWTAAKRLEFLTDFSDALEKLPPESPAVLALEAGVGVVFRGSWDRLLDLDLLQDMGKFRRYDPRSLRDLLRLVRNKRHHYLELPQALRERIGGLPHGFLRYFEQRFPRLLLHCLSVGVRHLQHDKLLARWVIEVDPASSALLSQHATVNDTTSSVGRDVTAAIGDGGTGTVSRTLSPLSPSFVPAAQLATLSTKSDVTATPKSATTVEPAPMATEEAEMAVDSSPIATFDHATAIAAAEPPAELDDEDVDDAAPIAVAENTQGDDEVSAASATALSAAELNQVVVWRGSALATSLGTKGWWRDATDWHVAGSGLSVLRTQHHPQSKRARAAHLTKQATDFKYRTRLCSHWESSGGTACPMRKKGKCAFAHSPFELRVKENRRDKWPRDETSAPASLIASGGEDVLGSARASDAASVPPSYGYGAVSDATAAAVAAVPTMQSYAAGPSYAMPYNACYASPPQPYHGHMPPVPSSPMYGAFPASYGHSSYGTAPPALPLPSYAAPGRFPHHLPPSSNDNSHGYYAPSSEHD